MECEEPVGNEGFMTDRAAITAKPFSKEIPNPTKVLDGVWVSTTDESTPSDMTDPLPAVEGLLRGAKSSILITTPRLTKPEVCSLLNKAAERGVGVYSLVSALRLHEKFVTWGLAREVETIESTLLIADPSTNPRGLWFHGELTSQQGKTTSPIELEEDQVSEMWSHFSWLFWNASGDELFYGKRRRGMPLKPAPQGVPETLAVTSRGDGYTGLMTTDSTAEGWFSLDFLQTASLIPETRKVIVPLSNKLKPQIGRIRGKVLLADGNIDTSCVRSGSRLMVIDKPYSFLLTKAQTERFSEELPSASWRYEHSIPLDSVKGRVLLAQTWIPREGTPQVLS